MISLAAYPRAVLQITFEQCNCRKQALLKEAARRERILVELQMKRKKCFNFRRSKVPTRVKNSEKSDALVLIAQPCFCALLQ